MAEKGADLPQGPDVTGQSALSVEAARGLRGGLKGALTGFANGRGSVEALLHEIERISRYVSGRPKVSLGQATKSMKRLVHQYARGRLSDTGLPGVNWDELYRGVVKGRNDLAHTGTAAALAGTRVATLATVLLAALTELVKTNGLWMVRNVMVSNPICAQYWQTLADLRRTMLVNDYSALPLSEGLQDDGTWGCVRAEELAAFFAREDQGTPGCTLAEARNQVDGVPMPVYHASVVHEDTSLDTLLGESALKLPVIVTRPMGGRCEIVGIVTAFDLL